MTTTCESWTIQYANDDQPTIKVYGTREKAEATAKKRNKYQESYTIAEAKRDHYEKDSFDEFITNTVLEP